MSAPSLPQDESFTRLAAAIDAYAAKFGVQPNPWAWGVSETRMTDAINKAVETGEPMANDHNWYANLPPGTVA